MLSIKRIYAFYQTYFCFLSNVNMIAIKYDLILSVAFLSSSIHIEANIIKGCLLLQKAALLFGCSLEKVWSLCDYSLEKVWSLSKYSSEKVWRKEISTYKNTKITRKRVGQKEQREVFYHIFAKDKLHSAI